MSTEREKMLAGELYDALHPELVQERDRARDLCQLLNATREGGPGIEAGVAPEDIRQGWRYSLAATTVLLRLWFKH